MEELSFEASTHRSWRCDFTGEPTEFFDSSTWPLGMAGECTSPLRYWSSLVIFSHSMFPHNCWTGFIMFYPRDWFQLMFLDFEVYKVSFWMKKHKSLTWKRTWIWSTSPIIQRLDLGCLTAEERPTTVKTTTSWTDPTTGKKSFKETGTWREHSIFGCMTYRFWFWITVCWPQIICIINDIWCISNWYCLPAQATYVEICP